MKLPLIGQIPNRVLDERFLDRRRRSSTFALMAGAVVACSFFEYEVVRYHHIDWELFSVLVAMVTVKLGAMAWFHFTD